MSDFNKPLVSIITPVYNSELYIGKCIASVLNQSYKNWELILIDDFSTDGTYHIIKEYLKDKRIRYVQNSENSGPAASRNVGLKLSQGEYITFLDSDDFWSVDKIKSQIQFMLEHSIKMSHGNYYFCNLGGEIIKPVFVDKMIDYNTLLKGNQFKIMTVMLHKSLLSGIKFELIKHEDYAFFLRILKNKIISLNMSDNVDSFCRIGGMSVSSNKFKSAKWTWDIYRKYEKLSLIKSIYYFINYAFNGIRKYTR